MDIKDRIIEAVVEKLISFKLTEETEGDDGMDTPKGDALRAAFHRRKFQKAIGKNTRRSALGSDSQGQDEYKARMSAADKKSKAMPLNIKTTSKRGAKVRGVRGKSINTSRSTGREGAVADANARAFDKLVASLARRERKSNKVEEGLQKKKSRCWSGYEPTPGVTPFAKGSCRPKGEKKKK